MTVKEDLDGLIRLQEIDSRLDEIDWKRREVEQAIAQVRDPLTLLENERDALIEKVSTLRKEIQALELAVEENTGRISRSKEKLPLITTQKEYFALQKEIENMERQKQQDEELQLSKLELFEESQKAKDELVEKCIQEEADFIQNKADEEAEYTQFHEERERLLSQREVVARAVDPVCLSQYNRVMSRKEGPVVVKIIDGNCQGCHMTLPPQLYNNVRKGDTIISCSFCNRILYAEHQV
ncbi:MAG: C4-type zinc ribbon domain-containing protein [bacterium]|nr:C4-type zinc ribbon domain-containing protein [bacterium]